MNIYGIIRHNAYYDSVSLMQISRAVEDIEGVDAAMVCMGTQLNKDLLKDAGLLTEEFASSKPSDLIIAYRTVKTDLESLVLETVEAKLNAKQDDKDVDEQDPTSVGSAVKRYPESNLVLVSLPGQYAAREVRKALNKKLHVMLFSDNVRIDEELELKQLAHEKGLLMMGPDCGTAIINGKGLCFANKVRRGRIGIVGASGTGLQEVTVLIDRLGGGISQALGTGGRDLSYEIGGIMMLDAYRALEQDPETDVILLLSKPPVKEVELKIIEEVKKGQKPTIICFLNSELSHVNERVFGLNTLEQAAIKAVELELNKEVNLEDFDTLAAVDLESWKANVSKDQKYLRALYCGGTVCDEAAYIASTRLDKQDVYSNVGKVTRLSDAYHSVKHSFIDLGDDNFTVGKPHPMIEPSLRNARLIQEAKDKETAVILFDVEIGYGSHVEPTEVVLEAIREAKQIAKADNREIMFVAYVLGTDKDTQSLDKQIRLLKQEGVLVASSNARAAHLAIDLVGGLNA